MMRVDVSDEVVETTNVVEGVETGGLVGFGGSQSKEMVEISMLQVGLGLLGCLGNTMVTLLAPPHCLLMTLVPDFLHALRCLHGLPSGIS
jgi:hypothetical protein